MGTSGSTRGSIAFEVMRKLPILSIAVALAALGLVVACTGPRIGGVASGAAIYEQKCASCHGAGGQGVEGKYADALYGDWALPKLTRYIAENMPDDHPETLKPAEADAVARYVYDSFYSRAAQARLRPVRVQLAHLTNQQYVTTVADLLAELAGNSAPAAPAAAHGLSATYYNAALRGRFDATKKLHEVVDRQLDFNFAEGTPERARIGTAEFSVQWRGAVIADETGDYEFVIRTPNSMRVWINGDANQPADAVIDANVSRPDNPDHRVTLRLLGGRMYPIAIDYWALPGKAGSPPPAFSLRWKPPHGSERPIPARHLAPLKVKPTFVVATKFPADDSSQGYERGVSISKAWHEATTSAALEVANHVVRKLDQFAGTAATAPDRARKIEAFAERFMAAAIRRPLSDAERTTWVHNRFTAAPDVDTAAKRVVLLALKSPEFLYPELPVPADADRAVASRLAFALWDSGPDANLSEAAAAGKLHTRAQVMAQARRLLGDARARAKLRGFFYQWLQLRFVDDLRKDAALYPEFTPELIDDLRTSLNLFLDRVAWSPTADFRELLRADTLMANDRIARFYGLPAPAATDGEFVPVAAPAGQRSGVLTHPYVLAAFSYKSTSSPIHRGVFLTRNIVGRSLKSPPMAVAFNEAEFTPDMTMREKVVKLTRSETCQGCHAVINPLGFSLEWYDAVGRYRQEENGRPIDTVSDYQTDENRAVRLTGARDVAEFVIGNEQSNDAFIEQLFHYMVKQPIRAFGPETAARLRNSFIASDYNLQQLLAEIATIGALRELEAPTVALHPTPRP
jgi:mono/diheme cytochrome c family protein